MFNQPSVTGTESRHGIPPSPVALGGRNLQFPTITSTPQPPTDDTIGSITADDPEFARKLWTYIQNQLLRLQGMAVQ
jgi:hypothetical protein